MSSGLVAASSGSRRSSQQLPQGLTSPPKRHASVASGIQNEPTVIASRKHQLLLEAIGKSYVLPLYLSSGTLREETHHCVSFFCIWFWVSRPRLRNDLDLVVIVQYLSLLESLS